MGKYIKLVSRSSGGQAKEQTTAPSQGREWRVGREKGEEGGGMGRERRGVGRVVGAGRRKEMVEGRREAVE